MNSHKANWTAVPLEAGDSFESNGKTGSTIHQVYCLAGGTANISALGGGSFEWSATAGQEISVVVGSISIASGTFVGFKTMFSDGGGVYPGNLKY